MTQHDGVAHLEGKSHLRRLLAERNLDAGRTAEIDAEIRDAFERTVAILVLDMVGFSRISKAHGIIHYLAMIEQMELAARPAVVGNGGVVIKREADNLFAIFDGADHALEAALDISRGFEAVNGVVAAERAIHGSIGIGFGPTLVIGGEDLFGCEMNLASKLGEDLAGPSEILVSAAALADLPPDAYRFEPVRHVVGGSEVECYSYRGKLFAEGREVTPAAASDREGE